MQLYIYSKSICWIPCESGTYWIKAKDLNNQIVTVFAEHSTNVGLALRLVEKGSWLNSGFIGLWVEVLFDKDIQISA